MDTPTGGHPGQPSPTGNPHPPVDPPQPAVEEVLLEPEDGTEDESEPA